MTEKPKPMQYNTCITIDTRDLNAQQIIEKIMQAQIPQLLRKAIDEKLTKDWWSGYRVNGIFSRILKDTIEGADHLQYQQENLRVVGRPEPGRGPPTLREMVAISFKDIDNRQYRIELEGVFDKEGSSNYRLRVTAGDKGGVFTNRDFKTNFVKTKQSLLNLFAP